jgi:hypothetical protein
MANLVEAWNQHRRQNRSLAAGFFILLVLSAGAFYLLQRTQAASPEDLTNRLLLFVLWYLDISLILILTFILVRNLTRLLAERRRGVLGSRFRTKLVLTYVVLTFVFSVLFNTVNEKTARSEIEEYRRIEGVKVYHTTQHSKEPLAGAIGAEGVCGIFGEDGDRIDTGKDKGSCRNCNFCRMGRMSA